MKKKYTKVFDLTIVGYESDYIFQTICKNNYFYEGAILDKWTKYFFYAEKIFDIGANLGNHSIYWASNLTKCKNIYSFEPFEPNYELLKENIEINNMSNIIIPVNIAIGDKKKKVIVEEFNEDNYGATILKETQLPNNESSIDMIDIDFFVKAQGIPLVDFIKIDTEGYEVEILSGMKELLTNFKPVLWIEVGYKSYKAVFKTLQEYGYFIIDIEGFNVLFIHKDDLENGIEIYEYENALDNMFSYLEKVNIYYNNYIKTKNRLDEKNHKMIDVIENYNIIKKSNSDIASKYKISINNYEKMKDNYEKEKKKYFVMTYKLNTLEKDYKELESKYINQLKEEYFSNSKEIVILTEVSNYIKRIEIQNNYLKSENTEYQRKMKILKDTFIGKFLVWGYKILKKLQR